MTGASSSNGHTQRLQRSFQLSDRVLCVLIIERRNCKLAMLLCHCDEFRRQLYLAWRWRRICRYMDGLSHERRCDRRHGGRRGHSEYRVRDVCRWRRYDKGRTTKRGRRSRRCISWDAGRYEARWKIGKSGRWRGQVLGRERWRHVLWRGGTTWGIEGEPHSTSIQRSVLDRLHVAGCFFHLSAHPCGPKLAVSGLSCGTRHGVDEMLVPVVQALRAASSAVHAIQAWRSGQIKPGCGGSAPAPGAEGFIVMLIFARLDGKTVCAGDVCGRHVGWWRMTSRGAGG